MASPQTPQYSAFPAQPVPTPPTKRKGRGLAITALVLGVVALLTSWVPFIGIMGIIVGFVGALFGVLGLFLSTKVMSAIGGAVSVVAIIIGFSMTAGAVNSIDKQVNATVDVTFKVTGSAPSASVTYTSFSGGQFGSSSTSTVQLPWTQSGKVTGLGRAASLTVTTDEHGGSVTCEITANGKVVASQTASGTFAAANCDASL